MCASLCVIKFPLEDRTCTGLVSSRVLIDGSSQRMIRLTATRAGPAGLLLYSGPSAELDATAADPSSPSPRWWRSTGLDGLISVGLNKAEGRKRVAPPKRSGHGREGGTGQHMRARKAQVHAQLRRAEPKAGAGAATCAHACTHPRTHAAGIGK